MASVLAPRGLRPVQSPGGSGTFQMTTYKVAAAYTTNIYEGQLVSVVTATGYIVPYATDTTNAVPYVGVAAAFVKGEDLSGSSGDKDILIYDDPEQMFTIQMDASAAADLGDVIGQFFGLTTPATGSEAIRGQSTDAVDESTILAAFARPSILRGVRLNREMNESYADAYPWIDVRLTGNDHILSSHYVLPA